MDKYFLLVVIHVVVSAWAYPMLKATFPRLSQPSPVIPNVGAISAVFVCFLFLVVVVATAAYSLPWGL